MLTNYRMLTCFARFLNTSTYSTNCTQTHTKHATPSWQTALKHTQANGVPLVFHRHVKSHPRTFMFQYVSKSIHQGVASWFYNMLALEHNIMK